jgi:transposase
LGPYHAYEVAEMLGVSKQSVWQWVSQYNKSGPDGLERIGSGGRQWSYLSWEEEKEVLEPFWGKARDGEVITAKSIWPEISKAVGKNVTLDYVYKLLHRHGWRKLGPRPRHVKSNPATQEQFKKNCPTL